MPRPLVVNPELVVPAAELAISFARSAGPGGQNVNKVNTKAVLRWRVADSPAVPPDVRRRFVERYANRINAEGEVVLASDSYREQSRNVAACYARLQQMITSVLRAPRRRVKTRPSRAAVERRLQAKGRAAEKKGRRQFRADDRGD